MSHGFPTGPECGYAESNGDSAVAARPASTSTLKQRRSREKLVYAVTGGGHRQSYLNTLGPMLGLEPVSERISASLFWRLVRAERVLFATLDDDMITFVAIAMVRSIRRRQTAALFLRPQTCFSRDRWHHSAKRHFFRALRHLPYLTVAAITPFYIAPHYAEVAHCGICDPQYWDMCKSSALPNPSATPLSEEILARSNGRRILCAVGSLGSGKGMNFLGETLEKHPHITDHALVVCAGRVQPEEAEIATRLSRTGALVVDRFLSDAEMMSLYGIADSIWACYMPYYDQASGVFGRAVQFGVPPIVRDGSVIAAFAAANQVDHHAVPYDAHDTLANVLRGLSPRIKSETPEVRAARIALIARWRQGFMDGIGMELGKGAQEGLTG